MRTITLELLRHGPAHNQLLSPLTPYLALCENHGAVTLNVPFEHNQLLHRLDALSYSESEGARVFQLKDIAAILSKMLGQVPGLTAESSKQSSDVQPLTHLRLIISATELALLPFELALSPDGMPGAGQPLLLQSQMPVCLTREVRRASDDSFRWPIRPPRILFVAAAPQEVGEIPVDAHLLALRRAIDPWLRYGADAKKQEERLRELFIFLPNASIDAIAATCAENDFTHVHILAHGAEYTEGKDQRFALALHDPKNPDRADKVSGARLATALRGVRRAPQDGLARPAVVTMASCDSGNVGSVAGAGASIAHSLHEAGIGVVIASQFPLSFEGSVRLVEVLYDEFLWGRDPRLVIHDLRRRLFSQIPSRHDWASLTAYLALPDDFEKQLSAAKIKLAQESINAAHTYADALTLQKSELIEPAQRPSIVSDGIRERMETAKERLNDLIKEIPQEKAEIFGLLASAEKRQAEVWFRLENDANSKRLLSAARDHYWESFQTDRRLHWAITQFLSLTAVLAAIYGQRAEQDAASEAAQTRPESSLPTLWAMARMHSLYDLNHESNKQQAWAHGNLLELYLLSLLPEFGVAKDAIDAEGLALHHTERLIAVAGPRSFEAYSTRRQILRYLEWYKKLAKDDVLSALMPLAQRIFDRFPARVESWSEQ
jgi:hypothetical protein